MLDTFFFQAEDGIRDYKVTGVQTCALPTSGCRQVVQLIEAENLAFPAHPWSGALNTAASVHLLASSTHGITMDFKPHESPMQHELVADPWVQRDGFLDVRNTPGLGVTVREQTVTKYTFL